MIPAIAFGAVLVVFGVVFAATGRQRAFALVILGLFVLWIVKVLLLLGVIG